MKGFLSGVLTAWITLLLMAFTLLLCVKSIIVDATDTMMKKELTSHVVGAIVSNSSNISSEVINEVKNTIENNPEIREMVDKYFDQTLDILSDDDSKDRIDVSHELSGIIHEGEAVLNNHGITITEEQRKELDFIASSDEVNNLVNDTIQEVKEDLPSGTRKILKTYKSLTGGTMKVGVVILIIVSLVFIALLKKSYYKWLSNFGGSLITAGIMIGVIFRLLLNTLLNIIEAEDYFDVSISSLNTNGYILIFLGVFSIILKIIISKLMLKKKNTILLEEQGIVS